MRTRQFAQVLPCILIVLLGSVACLPKFREVNLTGLPVAVSRPDTQNVDVDVVIESASQKVQEILPGAYLSFFSFTGKCQDFPELRGQINLDFIQVRSVLFRQQVLMASVLVDTAQQTMEIRTKDYSAYYWSTEHLILHGLKASEVAAIVHKYLAVSGLSDCTVVLARGSAGGSWTVRCGPPDKVFRECLEIDPLTGEITVR